MALQPIQQYQNPQNSLLAILQGGNQTVTGILDKAIQIGRDLSNKQLQQEQDMLTMRNQETALAQRRAENLQTGIRDTQRFAQDVFQRNRAYEANRADTAWTQARTAQQDKLAQQRWEAQFGLQKQQFAASQAARAEAAGIRGRELTLREQELQAKRAEEQRTQDYFNRKYGAGGGAAASSAPTTYTGEQPDMATLAAAPPSATPTTPTTPPADAGLRSELNVLKGRIATAEDEKRKAKDPATVDNIQREIDTMNAQLGLVQDRIAASPKPTTSADPLVTESRKLTVDSKRQAAVDKEMNTLLQQPDIFPERAPAWGKMTAAGITKKISAAGGDVARAGLTPEEQALYDAAANEPVFTDLGKDRLAIERASAMRLDEKAFAEDQIKGLSEEQIAKRRRFWQLVRGQGAGVAPATTAAPATSGYSSTIESLK